LHREGMTIVIVTHDASVAAYAKRVITFSDGEIASDVSPAAALTRPPVGAGEPS